MEEESKNNNKGFKIFIIVIIIIIGFLFLFKKENQDKIIGMINSITNKEKTLSLIESLPKGDILDIKLYDDTIVKLYDNKLSFLNMDGTIIVEERFDFIDLDVYFGKDRIYSMDKSTGEIYYLNKKGEIIDNLEIDREIFNFEEINKNIIYHGKSLNMEDISILNENKVQIGHYSYENENILRYTTNKAGTKNVLALINLKLDSLKTRLVCYGENNEKLYEIDIDGEIVVYLELTSKDEIIVLTESGLHFIKDEGVLWKKELNLIKDIYIDDQIHILYSNYLETIDFEGNTKMKIGFDEDYKRIAGFKKDKIVYGNESLVIIEDDKEILKEEIQIIDLQTNRDKILIWGPEELKTYEIINK